MSPCCGCAISDLDIAAFEELFLYLILQSLEGPWNPGFYSANSIPGDKTREMRVWKVRSLLLIANEPGVCKGRSQQSHPELWNPAGWSFALSLCPPLPPRSELHLLTRVQGEKRYPTCVSAICVTAFPDRLPSCGPGRLLRNRPSQQDHREITPFTSSKV